MLCGRKKKRRQDQPLSQKAPIPVAKESVLRYTPEVHIVQEHECAPADPQVCAVCGKRIKLMPLKWAMPQPQQLTGSTYMEKEATVSFGEEHHSNCHASLYQNSAAELSTQHAEVFGMKGDHSEAAESPMNWAPLPTALYQPHSQKSSSFGSRNESVSSRSSQVRGRACGSERSCGSERRREVHRFAPHRRLAGGYNYASFAQLDRFAPQSPAYSPRPYSVHTARPVEAGSHAEERNVDVEASRGDETTSFYKPNKPTSASNDNSEYSTLKNHDTSVEQRRSTTKELYSQVDLHDEVGKQTSTIHVNPSYAAKPTAYPRASRLDQHYRSKSPTNVPIQWREWPAAPINTFQGDRAAMRPSGRYRFVSEQNRLCEEAELIETEHEFGYRC